MALKFRNAHLEMPAWRRDFYERNFDISIPYHSQLENHWEEMAEFEKLLDQAIFEAESQIKYLDEQEMEGGAAAPADDGRSSNGRPGGTRRRGAARFGRSAENTADSAFRDAVGRDVAGEQQPSAAARKKKKAISSKDKKKRWDAACEASLPYQVQLSLAQHRRILDAFEMTTKAQLPRYIPGVVRKLICNLKRKCSKQIDPHPAKDCDEPVAQLKRKKARMLVAISIYLVLVSFFVFMTGVRLNDNETSKMVLFSTLFNEITDEVLMTPLTFFILAGLWPTIAVGIFIKDVRFFLRQESRRAEAIRRLDARPEVVSPNDPFELSREWARIEAHGAFGGRDDGVNSETGNPGRQRRAGGVIVNGQYAGNSNHAWAFFNDLHHHGITTLAQLRDARNVSREFLLENIGLTEEQTGVFWESVHGSKPVAAAKQHWCLDWCPIQLPFLGGLRSAEEKAFSPPSSPRKVVPIMASSAHESKNEIDKDTDDDDDSSHSSSSSSSGRSGDKEGAEALRKWLDDIKKATVKGSRIFLPLTAARALLTRAPRHPDSRKHKFNAERGARHQAINAASDSSCTAVALCGNRCSGSK